MSFAVRDVEIEREFALDTETAAAVDNDLRARILDLLAEESRTVGSPTERLQADGEARAEPTVRHHVRRLEAAGLVEVARLEAVGGGTRKHYRANTGLLPYSLLADATESSSAARETMRRGAETLVDAVVANHGPAIRGVADDLEGTEGDGERTGDERTRIAFVLRMLVDRALTDLAEEGRFGTGDDARSGAGSETESGAG